MRHILPLLLIGLLAGAGTLPASEAPGTIQKIDPDHGTIVILARSKEYTLKFAGEVKALDADGNTLTDGIKSRELKEGAEVTIHYDRGAGSPILNEIRLGTTPAPDHRHDSKVGAHDPGKPNIGLKPLNEMTAEDKYKGEDGGLYGGGKNEPPPALLAAAKAETAKIVPLDERGEPSQDGKIGLISLSYSNATREFSYFVPIADADPQKSPFVKIVDCSQAGMATEKWVDPKGKPWVVTNHRLAQAGLSPAQVQVVWAKIANIRPQGDLPEHGQKLKNDTITYLQNAHAHFPNLRILYFSSRDYGGWTNTTLNPEPYAYEQGFVIRWLIQDQMKGNPELNPDPSKGPVKAPLILWGPYLWGDGITPRKSDGLTWERQDFIADGTHVSESGKKKVCDLLLKHFKEDPLARIWYVK